MCSVINMKVNIDIGRKYSTVGEFICRYILNVSTYYYELDGNVVY